MAEKAVATGNKIAVVATVASTLKPSCNLVESAAKDVGRKVEIIPELVDGAPGYPDERKRQGKT